ncbi:MAG TPA: hypothetical protein VEU97_08425 [Ktedonobacteraceae bacterium]|nr:hypothetical protein [Ktedonobacteraceae bacterium]
MGSNDVEIQKNVTATDRVKPNLYTPVGVLISDSPLYMISRTIVGTMVYSG